MKKEYDFTKGRRGAVVPASGKTRITIYLDDEVIQAFKAMSRATGKGYQTLINEALRERIDRRSEALEETLRRVLREELEQAG